MCFGIFFDMEIVHFIKQLNYYYLDSIKLAQNMVLKRRRRQKHHAIICRRRPHDRMLIRLTKGYRVRLEMVYIKMPKGLSQSICRFAQGIWIQEEINGPIISKWKSIIQCCIFIFTFIILLFRNKQREGFSVGEGDHITMLNVYEAFLKVKLRHF